MIEKNKMLDSINNTKKQIQEVWNEISENDVNNLREIWNDNACEEFIKKIGNLNKTIDEIINQLNQLESCWQKYEQQNIHS